MRVLLVLCLAVVTTGAPQGYNYPNQNIRRPPPTYLPPPPPTPIVTKHIYVHSAPEEYDDSPSQPVSLGPPHKHYRVIFIKAPVQPAKTVSVIPPQNEEKTLIYVLSKKTDESDIQINTQVTPTEPSKPEVFFIKYKTPEEALHAQHQIQAQYDALGGSTQVSDEGIAPVQSVVGSLGSLGSSGHSSHSGLSGSSGHNSIGGVSGLSSGLSGIGTSPSSGHGAFANNRYLPPK